MTEADRRPWRRPVPLLGDTTAASERAAFYLMWAHAPTLKRAIEELLDRGGRGAVADGIDRGPHLFASFVDGYRGSERGSKRAVREYDTGAFGAGFSWGR